MMEHAKRLLVTGAWWYENFIDYFKVSSLLLKFFIWKRLTNITMSISGRSDNQDRRLHCFQLPEMQGQAEGFAILYSHFANRMLEILFLNNFVLYKV